MLTSQKLSLELSELRQKINAMANSDEFAVDALESLNAEYRMADAKYSAALIQEAEELEHAPDSEVLTGNTLR